MNDTVFNIIGDAGLPVEWDDIEGMNISGSTGEWNFIPGEAGLIFFERRNGPVVQESGNIGLYADDSPQQIAQAILKLVL